MPTPQTRYDPVLSVAALQLRDTVSPVLPVTARPVGAAGGVVSTVVGSAPNTLTPLSYSGISKTFTGVAPCAATPRNDQSLVGSHAPELVIRNCTSRRNCDWPPG